MLILLKHRCWNKVHGCRAKSQAHGKKCLKGQKSPKFWSLPCLDGKFMLRFTEVMIYHQIQAKIFFVKSRDSKFCGKFWLWFHSNNLPLNHGNFRFWCYFCPDWMVDIGFNFSVRIYHSKWAITFSLQISWNFDCKFSMVKSCFNSIL